MQGKGGTMRKHLKAWIVGAAIVTACGGAVRPAARLLAAEGTNTLGLFESHSDVGTVTPAGTAKYDPNTGGYTVTAAGANTWYHVDNFHYLWKKASGDMVLTA